jgi:rubrerythrin
MKSLKKTTYLEAIAAAIEHEVKSFNFFLNLSEQLKPGPTKELFQQLAADGDEHINFIKEIYRQAEGKELPNLKDLSAIYKFHSSTIQKLMEKLERNMHQAVGDDERKALELAVLHGEDAKQFYGKLKDKFPDPKINMLFSRLQDFIDSNTNLIEAQAMALEQATPIDSQFFWEDESLMSDAAPRGEKNRKIGAKPTSGKSGAVAGAKPNTKSGTTRAAKPAKKKSSPGSGSGSKKSTPKKKAKSKSVAKPKPKAKGKTKPKAKVNTKSSSAKVASGGKKGKGSVAKKKSSGKKK